MGTRASAKKEAALDLKKYVLHYDDDIIAINKPAGLSVQGGTGTDTHVADLLDSLKLGLSRPPLLVHRLDRDTSGVLLLARSAGAARALSTSFADRAVEKVYWAAVMGCPDFGSDEVGLGMRTHEVRHV